MERGINFFVSKDLHYTHYDFGMHEVYPRGHDPSRYPVQNSTSYPYCAAGRVIVQRFGNFTACTAALVGKRHIITASQCAVWQNYEDDSPPGSPMLFQPGYHWGQWYPASWVLKSYWVKKYGEGMSWANVGTGGDWLVGVLDQEMESTNGIFGQELYSEQWNGQNMWNMLGYPVSSGGEELFFQGPMPVITAVDAQYGTRFELDGLTFVGESGGPVYGIFDGLPRIIGVISGNGAGSFTINAHGGPAMFRLIAKAVAEFP
jgi:hypothetical protein